MLMLMIDNDQVPELGTILNEPKYIFKTHNYISVPIMKSLILLQDIINRN
jgi:hypothetical protein